MPKAKDRLPWEGALLLALYIALPSYFALELGGGLPLLTASRVLLLVAAVGVLLRNRSIRALGKGLLLTSHKGLMVCLFVYFALLLGVNASFLGKTSEGIKQMFVTAVEEYGLVWILTMTLTSRKRVTDALKLLVAASGVLGILACVTVISDYNLFHLLNTAGRSELVVRAFYRYGMLRPTAGFHHAVYYGAFCAVMLPVEMYFVERTEKRWERKLYALCTAFTLAGLLLANSRGSQLAFACVAGLIFVLRLVRKEIWKLLKTYLPVILVAALLVGIVFVCCPAGQYRIRQALEAKPDATVSTETTDPGDPSDPTDPTETTEPTQSAPHMDTSFGENPDGLRSRLIQLSGIPYTLGISPLTGLGPNAHMEGRVAYEYAAGKWAYLKTVDVNIVAIVCQYGLLGLLGFLALYGAVGITLLRKPYRGDPLMHQLFLAFVCYLLCGLSVSSLDKWLWVFVGVTVSLVNILRKEQTEC